MSEAPADARRRAAAHLLVTPDELACPDGLLVVGDDLAHHLRRVLRLRDGDPVSVTDGAGRWRTSELRPAGRDVVLAVTGDVLDEAHVGRELVLATAIPKGDRVEWLVQKASELGADRIVLLHAARSVVRWKPDRAERQRRRLQRIADEALQQSRRVWRTVVDGPVDASDVLPSAVAAEPGGRQLTADDVTVAVGPEGGWTDGELALARDRVGLGPSVLRVETAAIAAVALGAAARRAP